jgi:hypothetical protein
MMPRIGVGAPGPGRAGPATQAGPAFDSADSVTGMLLPARPGPGGAWCRSLVWLGTWSEPLELPVTGGGAGGPGGCTTGPGRGGMVHWQSGAVLGLVVTVAGGGAVVMMVEKIPRNLATVAVGPSATGRGRHRATVTVKVAHTVRVGRSASLDSFK